MLSGSSSKSFTRLPGSPTGQSPFADLRFDCGATPASRERAVRRPAEGVANSSLVAARQGQQDARVGHGGQGGRRHGHHTCHRGHHAPVQPGMGALSK